jgi:hypothetical protein
VWLLAATSIVVSYFSTFVSSVPHFIAITLRTSTSTAADSGAAATKLGSGDTHRYSNCFVPPSSYLLLGLPVPFYQFRDSVTVEKID